jgi:transposase InsO family protein
MIVDDYSRKKWSFFMKKRSEVKKVLKHFLDDLKSQGKSTVHLTCDNVSKNTKHIKETCAGLGIHVEYTAPNTPQQNGVTERAFVMIEITPWQQ